MNFLSNLLKSNSLIASGYTENGYNNYTILFIIFYMLAIFANGMWNTNFNINDILYGYGIIVGKNLVGHGIDSALNSKHGEMPTTQTQAEQESIQNKKEFVSAVADTVVGKIIKDATEKK